ncbi:MAG: hypothetical protein IPM74_06990 [Crocinitomicaceae bacterium]|nr:hypothetical protein [Crocinitomicaceae bacterium]MBK8925645.1 hypothetical protein [Crocinitomicaceae bacterium]
MKKMKFILGALLAGSCLMISCKKNQPSTLMEGNFSGNFQGLVDGNDTIINSGYVVSVTRLDKSTVEVMGSLFSTFTPVVANNGLNVELVGSYDGLYEFLYQGETEKLTFTYAHDGDSAAYIGYRQ